MFGFGWPPRGWAQCDGQILPISQNQSLFSLLGTVYGRSRYPICAVVQERVWMVVRLRAPDTVRRR
ncbi:MAG: tail fiber protein [Thalassolituus sp.]